MHTIIINDDRTRATRDDGATATLKRVPGKRGLSAFWIAQTALHAGSGRTPEQAALDAFGLDDRCDDPDCVEARAERDADLRAERNY